MKLTFLGANHEVTGSCYYLEACGKKILIDYGMEQGQDYFENKPVPVPASEIDMVLLTHAHIDHSGKLPLLTKEGFDGQIFATEGTKELCSIMLMDSAHIQESEAEWKNRKAERAGKEPAVPLYDTQDAQNALKCFVGMEYGEEHYIADGIRICFRDAGHLLGSASIEIWIDEEGVSRKLIFSGDIGNSSQPLINDPTLPSEADYIIMESTYGDRSHDKPADYAVELAKVLQRTFDRGGNVVIPSFAVGRTQEMLYFIRQIKEAHMIHGHDDFEVYVDSPLAVEATGIFMKRMFRDFDQEAKELLSSGVNPIGFTGLKVAVSSEESRQINEDTRPKVILSASGMCEAGRIRHHLKHNLWRSESTILFVGYQSVGTLGRNLVEGASSVSLFGEEITVQAEILQLPGISGHADREGLLRWIGAVEKKPRMVFVTHGEDSVSTGFAARLHDEMGLNTCVPWSGTIYDLAKDEMEYAAEPVPVEKESAAVYSSVRQADTKKKSSPEKADYHEKNRMSKAYQELLRAAERFAGMIRHNEGGANADLKKLTKEINALVNKWDR